eukprot:jgi/Mesvir1/25124/Mv21582-RA.2
MHRARYFLANRLSAVTSAVLDTAPAVGFLSWRSSAEVSAPPWSPTPAFERRFSYPAAEPLSDGTPQGPLPSLLAPFSNLTLATRKEPLTITRAEGVYVYDKHGNKYLDGLAGLWCNALGGSCQRLRDAAVRQMDALPFYPSFWNRTTDTTLALADELLASFRPVVENGQVFFTSGGSDANDSIVKLVWYYHNAIGLPRKKKIIVRDRAYHGSSVLSGSLTGLALLHSGFDAPVTGLILRTSSPHYKRHARPGESEEDFSTRMADELDALIQREGADTIAAFFAEPVQGAGGVIPPPKTYFPKIQQVLKKHDILFVADEVVSAFGRLGTMLGSQKFDIKPDFITIAKAITSGYIPLGAAIINNERVARAITNMSDKMGGSFGHGFTYTGHPVACAVAREALSIYREPSYLANINAVIPAFWEGMATIAQQTDLVHEVRGVGLVCGIDLALSDKSLSLPDGAGGFHHDHRQLRPYRSQGG